VSQSCTTTTTITITITTITTTTSHLLTPPLTSSAKALFYLPPSAPVSLSEFTDRNSTRARTACSSPLLHSLAFFLLI
jgi:hypothetical protein